MSFIDIDLFSMLKAWKLWNIFIFKLIILLGFTFLYGSFGSWFIVLQYFCVIFVTLVTQFLKHLIWKPYPFFTLWCPLQWEPSTKVRMYFSSFGSLPMLYVWRLQAKSIYILSLEGWTSKAHQKSEGIMGTLRVY